MSLFSLPEWILPHLFVNKPFERISPTELDDLKERLSHFKEADPDVSVVIPAWNEGNNIYRTLSSLASNNTTLRVEIIVVNNNSKDHTQEVLDKLGVINLMQTRQGTPFARQMGLEKARGKYHLCADADSFYPPDWINLMVSPMLRDQQITGVYGRYSFIPPEGANRLGLFLYEIFTGFVIQLRKKKREYLNVYGFNMGFVTDIGRSAGGFSVKGARVYADVKGSDFENEAEDGRMALNLKTKGKLKLVTDPKARVFTSPRRLMDDGSIGKAFVKRVKRQLNSLKEYF